VSRAGETTSTLANQRRCTKLWGCHRDALLHEERAERVDGVLADALQGGRELRARAVAGALALRVRRVRRALFDRRALVLLLDLRLGAIAKCEKAANT